MWPSLVSHNLKKLFCIALSQLMLWGVNGQETFIANTRHIGLPDGLTHQVVYSFLEDSRGLMWIGTQYGLNRYDGHSFQHWTPIKDSLSQGAIHHLLEDRAGYIWAITGRHHRFNRKLKGITLIHHETEEVLDLTTAVGSLPFRLEEVEAFFTDEEHYLYFATWQGLYQYDGQSFSSLPKPVGVLPVALQSDDLFLGKEPERLVMFDRSGEVVKVMNIGNTEFFDEFTVAQGVALGKTGSQSLLQVERGQFSEVPISELETISGASRMVYDPENAWFWISEGNYLLAYDPKTGVVYDYKTDHPNIINEDILGLYVDKNGLLWIGTRIGFFILETMPNRFARYLHGSPSDKSVKELYRCRGILEHEGKLFVSTYLGPMMVDLATGQETLAPFPDGTWLIKKDDLGRTWACTDELHQWDWGTGKAEIINLPGKKYKHYDVLIDREGALWAHTHQGLFRLQDGQITKMERLNGFAAFEGCQVYAYHETVNGNIYIGTDQGLFLLDPERGLVNQFGPNGKNQQYLPAHQIQHIYEDADGYFWMATENEGIIKWHPKTFELQHLTRKNGLPTNTIYCTYEDEQGFLWFSTDFGIVQMEKSTLTIQTFLPSDGISYHEFNRMSHYRGRDGRLYFGSQNGVTAFYPRDFWEDLEKDKLPPLQIYQYTEGHKFGALQLEDTEKVRKQKQLKFTHDVRSLVFRLLPPNYFLADKISYHYRVQPLGDIPNSPFSGDWVRSEINTVSILGIVPGRYKISIEARGLDGEQVAQPLEYDVFIAKPFFQTPLFRALALLTVLGGTLAFFLFRSKQMKKQQLLLQQMVEERTQQILQDREIIKEQEARIQQLDSMLNEQDGQWLQEVEKLVQQKLTSFDLNIGDIADDMNISRTHFFRKIKSITGMTPNQYLQEARLHVAKRLLESGEYDTVKAISLSVGFKKPSYFSHLFKQRFGFSPSDYFNHN